MAIANAQPHQPAEVLRHFGQGMVDYAIGVAGEPGDAFDRAASDLGSESIKLGLGPFYEVNSISHLAASSSRERFRPSRSSCRRWDILATKAGS